MRKARVLWVPLALMLSGVAAVAGPDLGTVRAGLVAMVDERPEVLAQRLGEMRAMFGMDAPKRPAAGVAKVAPLAGTPQVSSLNLRVALAKLAIYAGANQQLAVIAAQNGQTDAVTLRAGSATLDQVVAMADAAGAPGIQADGNQVTLTRPLIVWEDAELILPDGAEVQMTSDSGAFLLNFGRMRIGAARIWARDPRVDTPDAFRPFVLTAGTGSMQVTGAELHGLGSADAGPYSGLSVVNGGLFRAQDASSIRDTTIRDSGPVSLIRTSNSQVIGNRILGSRGVGLFVAEAQSPVISDNRIIGTRGLQALRITANSTGALVTGNLLAQGENSGALIDRNSADLTFTDNTIALNGAGAMRIQRGACIAISGNLIVANGGPGVGLDRVVNATLVDNIIAFNRAAGLSIAGQEAGWQTDVTRNLIADNGEGVRGATAGRLQMIDNRLEAQYPRLFSGDLGVHTVGYLTARQKGGQGGYLIAPADIAAQPDCGGV